MPRFNMIRKLLLSFLFFLISFFSFGQTFTDSTPGTSKTWTVPSGVTSVTLQIWGAGGAGGGSVINKDGGSGGGGGAYVSKTITVTPGEIITYSVGAGATGTTDTGANGGNTTLSTVSGTNLVANGGSGGKKAVQNAIVSGGTGGTGSGGSISNGSDGLSNSAAASSSSNGGNGGNSGNTGIGGSGAIGNNGGNGGAGTNPGGGGGGGAARSSVNGLGGNGGNGQVTITYSCPTYSINTITASDACEVGRQSTVTLTSTAQGLPVGTYTVEYYIYDSNTKKTASLTVTSAGTGTFTGDVSAIGVTATGSITVTKIVSSSCSTTLSTTSNQLRVIASKGKPAIQNGYFQCDRTWIAQWNNESVDGYYLDVALDNTFTNFLPGYNNKDVGNVQAWTISGLQYGGIYYYRVRSRNLCGASPNSDTITFNILGDGSSTPGTISGGATTLCVGSTTTFTISGSNPANGSWSIFNRTGSATISTSGVVTGVSAGTVRVVFTTQNGGGCGSSTFKDLTITGGTVGSPSSTPTVCINTPLTTITHTTTGFTGIGTPTFLPPNVTASFSNNTITITGTPSAAGTYNYSVPLNGGTCGTANATGTITVTANNTAATPSSNPTACIGTAMTAVTIATVGATGISNNGVSGANGLPAGVSASWASNTITISGSPSVSGTFSYSVPLTGGCGSVNATGTITVNAAPTFTTATQAKTCANRHITYATQTGKSNYAWSVSGVLNTDYKIIDRGTATDNYIVIEWLTVGSKTVSVNYTNPSGCSASTPATYTTEIVILDKGQVNGGKHICPGETLPTLTFNTYADRNVRYPDTSVILKWQYSDGNNTNYQDILGTAGQTSYTPTSIPGSTRQYRVVVDNGTCTDTSIYSAIDIDATTAITAQSTAGQTVCRGTAFTPISVTAVGTTINNEATLRYQWYSSAQSNMSNPTLITGATSNTYTPLSATTGTLYYYCVVRGQCGTVTSAVSGTFIVNANTAISNQSTGTQTRCMGTPFNSISVTATGATLTYQWYSNTAPSTSGGTPLGTSNGANTAIYTPQSGVATTLYYYCVVSGTCGSATSAISGAFIVNALPTITTAATPALVTEVCASSASQTTELAYTGSTGNATSYSIDWASLADQASTPFTFAGGGGSVTGITVPAGTVAGTYTGVMTITNGNTCSTSLNITLKVNQNFVAPSVTTIVQPNCNTATGSVVLSGLPASGFLLVNDGTTTTRISFSSSTISGLAPGSYRFAVDNGCAVTYSTTPAVIGINTWNGTNWSYGTNPTSTDPVIFAANYNITTNQTYCSVTVSNDAVVTVDGGKTLTVANGVHVVPGSQLIFENNSSLMQTTTSKTINTGSIKYKRKSTQIRQADYVYWSTPVYNMLLGAVSPLTDPSKMYAHNGSGWIYKPGTTIMVEGKGYIIRGPEGTSNTVRSDFEATFTGTPINGDITSEVMTGNKFYLVGNPYPSALSADDFITGNPNLTGTLYFWTHNKPVVLGGAYEYGDDDYAVYNLSGGTGVGTPAGSGSIPGNNNSEPTGFIGAGQGFFAGVQTNGTITFTNDMRAGGLGTDGKPLNGQFFKPGKSNKTAALEKHRLWLNMTNTQGAFKQLLLAYAEGATNSYDTRYDGQTFDGNQYLDFYTINGTTKLAIQGRALPFVDTDVVPLGYRSAIAGDFTIAISKTDGNMQTQKMYLEDKTTGKIHDLTESNYTFTTAIGTFTDRFVLRYTNKSLGTGDFENIENGVLVSIKEKTVKVLSSNENLKEVNVYDISGKLLYNKTKIDSNELQVSNLQSSNQVLIVKVTLENDFTVSKKIIFN
ncbi:T9SS sorting signal type C domain-containing protein [Flavobacterium sp. LHD-80]|uniref:T9SS sorting signal type C domain-containing protein n=1 Tax=Flavobacterium sp. LHD-80 TaxID=3071411 RepID=UPI0027E1182B|nr:T9SS sorting signal type C domain-containing protein [Flavobacterium sp. LHD-80]MDQ6471269.1 T9SS sorting signal type C domain-containing protein [Flavobacterium sp. LHD-80]